MAEGERFELERFCGPERSGSPASEIPERARRVKGLKAATMERSLLRISAVLKVEKVERAHSKAVLFS
jgi:hypothetical protein